LELEVIVKVVDGQSFVVIGGRQGRVKSRDEIKAIIRERTGKRNFFRRAKREILRVFLAAIWATRPRHCNGYPLAENELS
jgi:hypothetical protein